MERLNSNKSSSIYGSPNLINSSSQQQQQQQQPALSSSYMTGQYMYSQNYGHTPYNPTPQYHYQQQHQLNNYVQPQSYGHIVQGYGGQILTSSGHHHHHHHHHQQYHQQQQQYIHQQHNKNKRNGDVMKRCRLQAA